VRSQLIATTLLLIGFAAIASCAKPPVRTKRASGPPPDAVGRKVYLQSCASCHGVNAAGSEGPNLRKRGLPAQVISATVTGGVKDEMPAFGAQLSKDEIAHVTAYVKSLQ